MSKRNISDPEKIRGYILGSKGKEISDNNSKLYSILVQSKVAQNKIILSDKLNNTPLYSYLYLGNMSCQAITNDWLILQGIFYYNISQMNRKKEIDRFPTAIIRNGKVVRTTFSSDSFIMESGVLKKGYYQDNTDNFSCVGLHEMEKSERDKILNLEVNKQTFTFKQKEYTMSGNEQGMVCILSEFAQADKIRLNYDAIHVFSIQDKLKFEPKSIDNNKKIKYLYFTLNADNFCPAFLILPEIVNCNLLFKIELDYNHMSDMFMMAIKEKQLISDRKHIYCYWDTFDEFIDFMSVFSLVHSKDEGMTKEMTESITKMCDHYNTNKQIINYWKNLYTSIEKLLKEFYTSFEGKIKLDNLNKVYKKLTEIRVAFDEANNDTDARKIIEEFSKNIKLYCYMIDNQILYNFNTLFNNIADSILKLNRGAIEGLPGLFRGIGSTIQKLGFYKKEVGDELFPFCLSTGGFLGNLKGNDEAIFDDLIIKVKEKIEKKEDAERERIADARIVLKNFNAKCVDIIVNTLTKKLAESRIIFNNIEEGYRNRMINDVYNALQEDLKNAEDLKYLENIINAFERDGKDVGTIILPNRLKKANEKITQYNIDLLDYEDKKMKAEKEKADELRKKEIIAYKNELAKQAKEKSAEYIYELMYAPDIGAYTFKDGTKMTEELYNKILEWYKYLIVYSKIYPAANVGVIQLVTNLKELLNAYPIHPYIIQDIVYKKLYPGLVEFAGGAPIAPFKIEPGIPILNMELMKSGTAY